MSQAELFSSTHRASFAGQDMVDSISMSEDWVLLSSCKEIRKHREKQSREAQELTIASLRTELRTARWSWLMSCTNLGTARPATRS